jgi:hypothetical protein
MPAPFEYGRFAFEFVEELDSLSNTEEVTNLITWFTAGFGLEQCIFYSSVPSPEKRLDTIVLTRPSPGITEWLKVSATEGLLMSILSCAA